MLKTGDIKPKKPRRVRATQVIPPSSANATDDPATNPQGTRRSPEFPFTLKRVQMPMACALREDWDIDELGR